MRGVGGIPILTSLKETPVNFAGVILSGVTRDSTGATLGLCTVKIFETATNIFRGSTISDASGNWSLNVTYSVGNAFFAVMYKPGSPDVAGTTVNTLIGA